MDNVSIRKSSIPYTVNLTGYSIGNAYHNPSAAILPDKNIPARVRHHRTMKAIETNNA